MALQFTDIMVDLETTGTDPSHSAVIEIGAVLFNYDTGEFGPTFNRCPDLLPMRFWDEGTREWWLNDKADLLASIYDRMEPAALVWNDFADFVGPYYGDLRFWAKPTSFDFPLVASHFRQLGIEMPFHYRLARDLNSFIAGLKGAANHPPMAHVPQVGTSHSALDDCWYQLSVLLHAKAGVWA